MSRNINVTVDEPPSEQNTVKDPGDLRIQLTWSSSPEITLFGTVEKGENKTSIANIIYIPKIKH